jgi:hypothetical protein
MAADELLAELLAQVPPGDDIAGAELNRFEGALHALATIDAVDADAWDERLRRHMGWPSREEELAEERRLNAGGTEEELLAVLPGPPGAVDGVRVLFALRFSDGISFELYRDDDRVDVDDFLDWHDLSDDVGTRYMGGGGGGGGRSWHATFRTAPPPQASWVELMGIRVRL